MKRPKPSIIAGLVEHLYHFKYFYVTQVHAGKKLELFLLMLIHKHLRSFSHYRSCDKENSKFHWDVSSASVTWSEISKLYL